MSRERQKIVRISPVRV